MGVTLFRGLAGGLGVVLMVGGIALMAVPDPVGSLSGPLFLFLPGAILVAGVLLERTRYRSLKAERTGDLHGPGGGEPVRPDDPFRPTDERFIDPATGDRRYVAEG